jgi:hypothetical protein
MSHMLEEWSRMAALMIWWWGVCGVSQWLSLLAVTETIIGYCKLSYCILIAKV